MSNDVLIGHNVLEKAKLIVDPTMEGDEGYWAEMAKLFEGVTAPEPSTHTMEWPFTSTITVEDAYKLITNNNISFDQLFEHARLTGAGSKQQDKG